MPQCLDVMNQYGNYGEDTRSMGLPATLVDICPGDFLGSDTASSALVANPISADVAWDTNLATTQTAAKLVFQGVAVLTSRPHGFRVRVFPLGRIQAQTCCLTTLSSSRQRLVRLCSVRSRIPGRLLKRTPKLSSTGSSKILLHC